MKKTKKKPSPQLAQRYKDAHWGLEGQTVYEFDDPDLPDELCGMGTLLELGFETDDVEGLIQFDEGECLLAFTQDEAERLYVCQSKRAQKNNRVDLWQGDASQAYPINEVVAYAGGRQAEYPYNLDGRVQVQPIGKATYCLYFTEKKGDGPSLYEHKFGEESGILPWLAVDKTGRIWFCGGNYTCPDAGITD